MEDYNKIIESLGVKFIKARNIRILQPIRIKNFYDVENSLLILYKGEVSFGEEETPVEEGDMLFIPGGKMISVTYGNAEKPKAVNNEEFMTHRELYFDQNTDASLIGTQPNSFGMVAFEAKVFDSVNFFTSLDIPPFLIKRDDKLAATIREILEEDLSDAIGKGRIIKIKTEEIVIEVIRYIIENRLFVEQLATNSTYFKDPRLIDIFAYIKDHLGGDLSNKVLANVANVSEDYVGQYFKMLTGINPQDYIEYQRMEAAVGLLRTTKKSIRAIGSEVGYKDTAYFCRRFKMMFGIPAGKMRRRESLMNI
ncbi:AraC family transcriptional regulator [Aquirufa sp. KTFRIE-69F]|jgi:AraC-like DNA-binding protein|uniref:AraC family transcriptional regulator n=4 Tax=Aquirufa TaxID=2676247 RepID=A0A4Q9BHH1_9BACT|nr:AraC family transcriptional regulator [Aquirufa antheringensis]MCE4217783.1 helix-turn-helix domain-containing protein [Pseudarcicella sp. GAP-15]MCZ2477544.1 helix-turn-helix transcriptional regulator [Aquirufa antheringensis]MCZ2485215.1 helix-turn-helix transcriptional regulator [Aquirufa antheringensis]MCZ2487400.1 helix-turn-helix transcriptional regulator [Aquirufa antheringensis]MCZ2490364.1 helix-turn-helix transcriptional regulator [Aquirufa antheringensis]